MTNEKSFEEVQAMTNTERREYYAQREKSTNNLPVKKIRAPTRKINKRKVRRQMNREIRKKVYDRPFGNPQYQEKIAASNTRKKDKLLRRLGYRTPIPSQ